MKRSGVLCLIIMAMSALALHSATGIQDTYATVKAALLGGKPAEAKGAMARISRERSEAIDTLITVAKRPDGDNSWQGVRHKAVLLLGELAAREAVGPLADIITFMPTGPLNTDESAPREAYYPAALSLTRIGLPAVKSMLGLISTSRDEEARNLASWVILQVEGKEQADFVFERELTRAYGDSKPRLEAARKFVREYKPVFTPPGWDLKPSKPAKQ